MLRVILVRTSRTIVLRFFGELDTFNLPQLADKISPLLEPEADVENLVLNFKELKYISVAGFGFFLKLKRKMTERGKAMVVASPNQFFKETFATLGLSGVIPTYESEEEALDAVLS